MERVPFFDNGFVNLRESPELHVPVGCIYYEYYRSDGNLSDMLNANKSHIQQIVANFAAIPGSVRFGQAHDFPLWDFDDHKDTMQFLIDE
jgi:hypothetical protein